MSQHNYSDWSYENSPLHTAISQLLQSLCVLKKKIENHELEATDNESKYLNQFHQLWSSLDHDLLPIFTKGQKPGLGNFKEANRFDDEVIAFSPKRTIETPLDYEIAKCLQTFMTPLLQKNLITIAPFLNIKNIDVTIWGFDVGKKIRKQMNKLGLDDLLLPNQFQTNFNNKYDALTAKIETYSSLNVKSNAGQSPSTPESRSLSSSSFTIESQPSMEDISPIPITDEVKKPQPIKNNTAKIKSLNPTFKRLLTMSQSIAKIGRIEDNRALIYLSIALQQRVGEFKNLYQNKTKRSVYSQYDKVTSYTKTPRNVGNIDLSRDIKKTPKIKLTLDDCDLFKSDVDRIINQIEGQMATVKNTYARSLWAIFSLNFRPIINKFVTILQHIISPLIDVSTHRNSMFSAPESKIIEDLRDIVSKIPVTPQVRHPERVFLREGSPECYGFCHLPGDPSRKKTRSG